MAFRMNRPLIKGTKLHKASVLKAKEPVVAQTRTQADPGLVGAGRELGRSYVPGAVDFDLKYNPNLDFPEKEKKKLEEVEEVEGVKGCMDANANNYDSTATVDDGSCTYDDTKEEEGGGEGEEEKDEKKKKKKSIKERLISEYNKIKKRIQEKKKKKKSHWPPNKDAEEAYLDEEADTAQDDKKPMRPDYDNPSDHMRALMEWHKRQEAKEKAEVDQSSLLPQPPLEETEPHTVENKPEWWADKIVPIRPWETPTAPELPSVVESIPRISDNQKEVIPAHENPNYHPEQLLSPDAQRMNVKPVSLQKQVNDMIMDGNITLQEGSVPYYGTYSDRTMDGNYEYTNIVVDEDENGEKDGVFEEMEVWLYNGRPIKEGEVPAKVYTTIMEGRLQQLKEEESKSSAVKLRDNRIFRNAVPGGIIQKTMLKNGYNPKN